MQQTESRTTGQRCLLLLAVLGALVGLALLPQAALAAPGDLDPTFGSGGIITSHLEESGASDVEVQADGKIVVVGSTGACASESEAYVCHSEFLVERYNPDGTLDTSFGDGDGIVTTSFGSASQGASSLAIELDGKLLVGGTTYNETQEASEFALARYNPDGTLDTSFGDGDGKATAAIPDTGGPRMWSGSMVEQSDGKIVLGGEVQIRETLGEETFGVEHAVLVRLNSDGSLDTSFGSAGTAIGPKARLYGLDEAPSGKLVAAIRTIHNHNFGVAEFNADGSLNTGFGSGGVAELELSPTGSQASDVLVQPNGKIVASGYGYTLAIARFNSNGTPDPSFGGGDGLIYTSFQQPCCGLGSVIALALEANGRIAFAGQWRPDEDSFKDEWAVGRLYANGSPDSGFGTHGLTTTAVAGGGYGDYANALALQPDGKLVAAGSTGMAGPDLALARYFGGSSPEPTFHHVLISKASTGEGRVTGDGALNCGVNCGESYLTGETVQLEAWAETDSSFSGWSTISGDPGTCTSTTTPCEVTLDGDVELVATFGGGPPPPIQHTLSLAKPGSGSGTVTSSPAGIACGTTCNADFDNGTAVVLTATPAPGSSFTGWSGGGCGGIGACEVTLHADSTITATFTADSPGGKGKGPPVIVPQPESPATQPSISTPTQPKAKKPPKKKSLKCRKGFKKRKVHGKPKCVKAKKKLGGRTSRQQRFAGTSSDTSSRQACIKAALVMPKVKRAYIAHPGHKPFEKDPTKVGAVQTTNVAVWYPAMKPECAPFTQRYGQAKFEKQVGKHKKWATYARYEDSWGYSSNGAGGDGVVRQESGHGEPDRIYWHPGERFRMTLQNRARDPESHATLATKSKIVPIQIRRR